MYRPGMPVGSGFYVYGQDGLGSVTEIFDFISGLPVETYTYDAFGLPSVTNSVVGNPFMFTGRQWDGETTTYQYRARQYDPVTGRFLQRDPIGYADSMNLYSYVVNDPVNWVDPWGLIRIGNYELQWHKNDHGGPHWQIFDKNGLTTGRFRADGTPIKFKGKVSAIPGIVRRWMQKAGYLPAIVAGLVTWAITGDPAEAAFPADNLYNEDEDLNDDGIPDWKEQWENKDCKKSSKPEYEGVKG